jgi:hypothetical protein
MATRAIETGEHYLRAIGALNKRGWTLHLRPDMWAFDAFSTQMRYGLKARALVLRPNFEVGDLDLYLSVFSTRLFSRGAKPPQSLHQPFEIQIVGKHWHAMAKAIELELDAIINIEKATGLGTRRRNEQIEDRHQKTSFARCLYK